MKPAYAPWAQHFTGNEQLVHAATLAANAHDAQPWTFGIIDNRIEIYADTNRNLRSFDPFRRELFQSLGCATENIAVAASAQGRETIVDAMPGRLPPDGTGPAVVVRVGPETATPWPELDTIRARRTHRGVYLDRPLPEAVLADLRVLAAMSEDVRLVLLTGDERRLLADRIVAATEAIVADAEMATDNARWFRFRERDVEKHRDGLTLDANVVAEPMHTLATLFPPSPEAANARWVKDTRNIHVATAAALGILAVRDPYDRRTAIEVGRLWQRIHLRLTELGIAAQPLNQPVEIVDRRRQLGGEPDEIESLTRFSNDPLWEPTFVFRAGYPKRDARHSPRRALGEVLREGS